MKNAFKKTYLYFIGLGLGIIGIGIPLGIYVITCIPSLNANPFPYIYLHLIFLLVYLFLGWTIADIQNARWRHKNSDFESKLPEEQREKAWSIRIPFFLGALIILLFVLVFEIIYWITGGYPMPFE